MPDQPSDTKKTAIKIAMGAALGSALGVAAALRKGSNEQRTTSNAVGKHSRMPSPAQPTDSTQSSVLMPPEGQPRHSPDRPDWEPLPAAHLPRPTYWPVVLAAGVVFLAWGIVTTIAISMIGLLLLALALGGWIGELRHGR